MQSDMRTVELFCGTKSFSNVMMDHGHRFATILQEIAPLKRRGFSYKNIKQFYRFCHEIYKRVAPTIGGFSIESCHDSPIVV
jgi:hypothetical protein